MPRVEYPLTPVNEVPEVGSKLVDFFGRTIHVVRGEGGAPVAFMNVCLHFGGTLACQNGEFLCEWHGATFDRLTGRRTSGPAPEGSKLMRLPTEVRDGVVTYVFAWGDDAAPASYPS
jgi:3-phenylpropionate/trans-cinnamate dioxygenase ferredoxin subunit